MAGSRKVYHEKEKGCFLTVQGSTGKKLPRRDQHRSHEAKGGSPRTCRHQHLPFGYRHGQQLELKPLQKRDEE